MLKICLTNIELGDCFNYHDFYPQSVFKRKEVVLTYIFIRCAPSEIYFAAFLIYFALFIFYYI
jgi:hypothetical protein